MSPDGQPDNQAESDDTVSRQEFESLQSRVTQLRDALQHEVGTRFDTTDDRIDELEDELHQVHREVDMLREEVESFAGPMSEKTDREKRLADTRLAMIRNARANRDNNVNDGKSKKHFHEIRDILSQMGHENGLSKPALSKLIDDIAEQSQGFETGQKPRVGKDGVSRDCHALKLNLADLPAHEESKGVTTGDGEEPATNTAEAVEAMD